MTEIPPNQKQPKEPTSMVERSEADTRTEQKQRAVLETEPGASLAPEQFASVLLAVLGVRLRSLYQIGSSARGEHNKDSDYDFIVVVDRLDDELIDTLRDLLRKFPLGRGGECVIQPFVWSMRQLATLPRHHFYLGAKWVLGEDFLREPSGEDLKLAFAEITRNIMNTLTHYLILDHDSAHVASRIYSKLKQLYYALAIAYRLELGVFPTNRLQLIAHLEQRGDSEGAKLVSMLAEWANHSRQERLTHSPRPMLGRILQYTENLLH